MWPHVAGMTKKLGWHGYTAAVCGVAMGTAINFDTDTNTDSWVAWLRCLQPCNLSNTLFVFDIYMPANSAGMAPG